MLAPPHGVSCRHEEPRRIVRYRYRALAFCLTRVEARTDETVTSQILTSLVSKRWTPAACASTPFLWWKVAALFSLQFVAGLSPRYFDAFAGAKWRSCLCKKPSVLVLAGPWALQLKRLHPNRSGRSRVGTKIALPASLTASPVSVCSSQGKCREPPRVLGTPSGTVRS